MSVFCDWLDVTFSPLRSPVDTLRDWLDKNSFTVDHSDGSRVVYRVSDGKLVIQEHYKFIRVSASGSVISHFRLVGLFDDYLGLLADFPHQVTRLDAALDVPVDAPVILRGLESKYPADAVCLSRKSSRVTRVYSTRDDGQLTGTWYVGHRSKARVTARVYDKQNERLEKAGVTIPPTTRYELTFKKDVGCTLKDAQMPDAVFYKFASPTLLERPDGVSDWEPHAEGWESSLPAPDSDFTLWDLMDRADASPEIQRILELAARFGDNGRKLLVNHIDKNLSREISKSKTSLASNS